MTKLILTFLTLFLMLVNGVVAAQEWTGRWAIDRATCADEGYDLFISKRDFVIWEQSCKILKVRKSGPKVRLGLQCSGEGAAPSNEFVELRVLGNVIERTDGYWFQPNVMKRCR